ncbi:PLDc N-terminal domain-containing protein [Alteromonas sp. 5E99-2]|uniref:PLDc N-terminal domain-containing protein n=1 Tax=Alteromonas sp. 5E99-2 TaxID=2817683 RepID=UPI001A9A08EF|nr:PLDc N-terminal domain-containing protein [Alteromonas sp. 5E99-2]MBO1256276.1 PLDc N-terminal domain-containing protein [Alteromonas sp. 5E99-2]
MDILCFLFSFFFGAIIWLIPVVMILVSKRSEGGEKAAWILAVIFISWFAWIFYLLLAPLTSRRRAY